METNKLYHIAARDGITVERVPLPLNGSVAVKNGANLFIALDSDIDTKAQERVCLAHELGHCETLSFYNIYSQFDVRAKHEYRANRWAIQKLVPRGCYEKALKDGYRDIASLAEYFDVTEEFMHKTVEYYRTNPGGD